MQNKRIVLVIVALLGLGLVALGVIGAGAVGNGRGAEVVETNDQLEYDPDRIISADSDAAENAARSSVYQFDPFPAHGPQIDGAGAQLTTNEAGASVEIKTSDLTPNDAVTVWWIIFNNPEACAGYPTGECGLEDLFGNTAAVGGEVTYATGTVIGADGRANFKAHLPVGEVRKGWFGNGFTNPEGAEIHMIVHSHGELIPHLISDMTGTFRGGCEDDAMINPDFPPNAYNDGVPGPNQCVDLQFAVFKQ